MMIYQLNNVKTYFFSYYKFKNSPNIIFHIINSII